VRVVTDTTDKQHRHAHEDKQNFHAVRIGENKKNSILERIAKKACDSSMRLTRQERLSLSVLLIIFLFALIGWFIF